MKNFASNIRCIKWAVENSGVIRDIFSYEERSKVGNIRNILPTFPFVGDLWIEISLFMRQWEE